MIAEPATVQKGAVGYTITVSIIENGSAKDLSGATTKDLIVKYPSGAISTFTLTLSTLGHAYYVTQSSADLNEVGLLQLQARFVLPSGFDGKTKVSVLRVLSNLS